MKNKFLNILKSIAEFVIPCVLIFGIFMIVDSCSNKTIDDDNKVEVNTKKIEACGGEIDPSEFIDNEIYLEDIAEAIEDECSKYYHERIKECFTETDKEDINNCIADIFYY